MRMRVFRAVRMVARMRRLLLLLLEPLLLLLHLLFHPLLLLLHPLLLLLHSLLLGLQSGVLPGLAGLPHGVEVAEHFFHAKLAAQLSQPIDLGVGARSLGVGLGCELSDDRQVVLGQLASLFQRFQLG